jgi:hypothetical protein
MDGEKASDVNWRDKIVAVTNRMFNFMMLIHRSKFNVQ